MFEISASKITAYMDCPLKYKFRYVDKIEAEETPAGLAMGSAFHRTLKHYYNNLVKGQRLNMEEIERTFREDWEIQQTIPIRWNGDGPDALEQQGIDLIRTYLEGVGEVPVPQAVETSFRVPLVNLKTGETAKDIELVGIIDRVDNGPVEMKTSARSWNQLQADQSLQMSMYAYHQALQTKQERIQGRFEVVVKNKAPKLQIIDTERSVHDFDRLFRIVKEIVTCIDAEVYYPNPGMFCGGCEFADYCLLW